MLSRFRLTCKLPGLHFGGRHSIAESSHALRIFGEVVERLMALGCKPSVLMHYGGSNPPLSTKKLESGSNSVGRVIAFQAIGRGFESRLPLQNSAHVAQSAERVLGKDEVISSNLIVGSINGANKLELVGY
jgi:hypothetical protein